MHRSNRQYEKVTKSKYLTYQYQLSLYFFTRFQEITYFFHTFTYCYLDWQALRYFISKHTGISPKQFRIM